MRDEFMSVRFLPEENLDLCEYYLSRLYEDGPNYIKVNKQLFLKHFYAALAKIITMEKNVN
jgi:hypothetical protein